MNVVKATHLFEAWLAQRTHINQKDLRLKHSRMRDELFAFFRATFYRWATNPPRNLDSNTARNFSANSAAFLRASPR